MIFVGAEPEMGVYTTGAGGAKPVYVTVELCGKHVVMQLDTGSAKSLIRKSLC